MHTKEKLFCVLQEWNIFCGNIHMCNHNKEAQVIINHLTTRFKKCLVTNIIEDKKRYLDKFIYSYAMSIKESYQKVWKITQYKKLFLMTKSKILVDTKIKTDVCVKYDQ